MPFQVKNWHDTPNLTTPVDADALEDLEQRLSDYADQVAGQAVNPDDLGSITPPMLSGSLAGLFDGAFSREINVPRFPQGIGGPLNAVVQTFPVALFPGSYIGTGVDEVQSVTVTGNPFSLTFNGQTTSSISSSATAAQVQSALEALSNIGIGDVTVTGSGPYTVTFQGTLGRQNVNQMTALNATIATVQAGSDPPADSAKAFFPIEPVGIGAPSGYTLQFRISISAIVSATAPTGGTKLFVSLRPAIFAGGVATGPFVRPGNAIVTKEITPLLAGVISQPPVIDSDWFSASLLSAGHYAIEARVDTTLPANCSISLKCGLIARVV